MSLITEQISINELKVKTSHTNIEIGIFMKMEDGYYSFKLKDSGGYFIDSYDLRLLADKLDAENKEWNDLMKHA